MAVLIPMISPRSLTSAPPELPGLIAASVCSMLTRSGPSPPPGRVRPVALMIPEVTVLSRPNGEPMAIAVEPTIGAASA
jgi:hypothetical protein